MDRTPRTTPRTTPQKRPFEDGKDHIRNVPVKVVDTEPAQTLTLPIQEVLTPETIEHCSLLFETTVKGSMLNASITNEDEDPHVTVCMLPSRIMNIVIMTKKAYKEPIFPGIQRLAHQVSSICSRTDDSGKLTLIEEFQYALDSSNFIRETTWTWADLLLHFVTYSKVLQYKLDWPFEPNVTGTGMRLHQIDSKYFLFLAETLVKTAQVYGGAQVLSDYQTSLVAAFPVGYALCTGVSLALSYALYMFAINERPSPTRMVQITLSFGSLDFHKIAVDNAELFRDRYTVPTETTWFGMDVSPLMNLFTGRRNQLEYLPDAFKYQKFSNMSEKYAMYFSNIKPGAPGFDKKKLAAVNILRKEMEDIVKRHLNILKKSEMPIAFDQRMKWFGFSLYLRGALNRNLVSDGTYSDIVVQILPYISSMSIFLGLVTPPSEDNRKAKERATIRKEDAVERAEIRMEGAAERAEIRAEKAEIRMEERQAASSSEEPRELNEEHKAQLESAKQKANEAEHNFRNFDYSIDVQAPLQGGRAIESSAFIFNAVTSLQTLETRIEQLQKDKADMVRIFDHTFINVESRFIEYTKFTKEFTQHNIDAINLVNECWINCICNDIRVDYVKIPSLYDQSLLTAVKSYIKNLNNRIICAKTDTTLFSSIKRFFNIDTNKLKEMETNVRKLKKAFTKSKDRNMSALSSSEIKKNKDDINKQLLTKFTYIDTLEDSWGNIVKRADFRDFKIVQRLYETARDSLWNIKKEHELAQNIFVTTRRNTNGFLVGNIIEHTETMESFLKQDNDCHQRASRALNKFFVSLILSDSSKLFDMEMVSPPHSYGLETYIKEQVTKVSPAIFAKLQKALLPNSLYETDLEEARKVVLRQLDTPFTEIDDLKYFWTGITQSGSQELITRTLRAYGITTTTLNRSQTILKQHRNTFNIDNIDKTNHPNRLAQYNAYINEDRRLHNTASSRLCEFFRDVIINDTDNKVIVEWVHHRYYKELIELLSNEISTRTRDGTLHTHIDNTLGAIMDILGQPRDASSGDDDKDDDDDDDDDDDYDDDEDTDAVFHSGFEKNGKSRNVSMVDVVVAKFMRDLDLA